jgi:hypothetical protein
MPVEDFTYIETRFSCSSNGGAMFFCWIVFVRLALVSYLYICTLGFSFAVRSILHILEFLNLDSIFPTRGDRYRDDIHVS